MKTEQEIKELKEHSKFIDESNKILYQEKCELIKKNKNLEEALAKIEKIAKGLAQTKVPLCTIAAEEIREAISKVKGQEREKNNNG